MVFVVLPGACLVWCGYKGLRIGSEVMSGGDGRCMVNVCLPRETVFV